MHLLVVSVLLVVGFPFIISDVVDSFTKCSEVFFNDQPPVIPGILEISASQDNNRYKPICQKYENAYRFATLYDTQNKIPVLSAYKYTGSHKKKRPPWRTEPQPQLEASNQASDEDYKNNNQNLDRGHLFPCSYAADKDTFDSTFTLTNAVPQHKRFNCGSWNLMEQTVRGIMTSHCRDEKNTEEILAYVLTGAVPNTETPPYTLKNRVNIPSHLWTAFCCYNSDSKKWMSQAHWAENKDESKTISAQTLEKLQNFLKSKYNKDYTLFNGDCLDFLDAGVSQTQEADADDCDKPDIEEQ